MAVYYVDADELDGIANATSNTRNDLYWTLKPLEAGQWVVPWQRDTQGQWNEIRSLINGELGLLDGDARGLRDRAGRVRAISDGGLSMSQVLSWLGTGLAVPAATLSIANLGQKIGLETANSVIEYGIARSPKFALQHIARGWTSTGLRTLSGGHVARWLSGVGAAKTLHQGTLVARYGRHLKLAGSVGKAAGVAIAAGFAFADNLEDYMSLGWATVASGTAIDLALSVGAAAAVVAIVGLAPVSLPAIGVGIAFGVAVGFLRETPAYRGFVRGVGAAADQLVESGQNVYRRTEEALDEGMQRVGAAASSFGNWLTKPRFAF